VAARTCRHAVRDREGGPAQPARGSRAAAAPDDLPPSRRRDIAMGPPAAHGRHADDLCYDENLRIAKSQCSGNPRNSVTPFGRVTWRVSVRFFRSFHQSRCWWPSPVPTGPAHMCVRGNRRGTTNPEWAFPGKSNLWVLPTIAVFAAMLPRVGARRAAASEAYPAVRAPPIANTPARLSERWARRNRRAGARFQRGGREDRLQLAEKGTNANARSSAIFCKSTHDVDDSVDRAPRALGSVARGAKARRFRLCAHLCLR